MQYRPISLCVVLYKIIAKVTANQLKKVLGACIDVAQSTFVRDKMIKDNVLLVYEILHSFKAKQWENKGYFAWKFDISKVYDRVEWSFLRSMMERMGFGDSCV